MALTSLPFDILVLVIETLNVHDLTALSQTCRSMHALVTEHGWSAYLRSNPRSSCSLSKAMKFWHPRTRARYDAIADAGWSNRNFIARPLSAKWARKFQPILAISASRLVIGAGSDLYSYAFSMSNDLLASPPVLYEGSVSFLNQSNRARNITSLTFIEDGDLDLTLEVAFLDGDIERVYLSTSPKPSSDVSVTRHSLPPMPENDVVESLCSQSGTTLALSSTGYARLTSLSGNTSNTIELKSRSWTSHLCLSASTPYAAFGMSSTSPLVVHAVSEGGLLSPQPMAILHTHTASAANLIPREEFGSSAVYGICQGPLNSPWGASPQVLVSGWFDGQVRIYDLRSPSSFSVRRPPSPPSDDDSHSNAATTTTSIPIHRPVLSLADPWSYEPIYSVASGGGSAAHIAAGTSCHGIVSFWDIRKPSGGWSVHAPGNDPSPVYSVVMDSSRFFGVTQNRPFVYDFGPGVSLDTYPSFVPISGIDHLKRKKGSHRATYHVIKYGHGLHREH